ncbi:MAG: TolC family protein [Zavarzinella sp.]
MRWQGCLIIFLMQSPLVWAQDQFASDRVVPPVVNVPPATKKVPQQQELLPANFQQPKLNPLPKIPDKLPNFNIVLPELSPAIPRTLPRLQGTPPSAVLGDLTLSEVLQSVDNHFPLLQAARLERSVAEGKLLSAFGAFDLNITAASYNSPLATYENYGFTTGLSQAFTDSGVNVFSRYRGGFGDYPVYKGGDKTAEGGEFRAGVSIPLLQNRDIDRARANLQQATIGRDAVEPLIQLQNIRLQLAASRAYYAWVATGQRLRIARELAKLAQDRDEQLRAVVAGQVAAKVERANNLQSLYGRNASLVEAEEMFAKAAVDLSMFLRDTNGESVLPAYGRLPNFPMMSEPDGEQLQAAIDYAWQNRPELLRLAYQREVLEVELRQSQNLTQPAFNAIISGATDVGFGKPATGPSRLDRQSVDVGVEFRLPYQRRDALGKVFAIQAQLAQVNQEIRNQRDVIRTEVQNAFVALERAHEQTKQVSERVRYGRMVADGEQVLFEAGFSEVFKVNIQEQFAFDAQLGEVSAQLKYFIAEAQYKAALGYLVPVR